MSSRSALPDPSSCPYLLFDLSSLCAFPAWREIFRLCLQRPAPKVFGLFHLFTSEPIQALQRQDDIREAVNAFIELGISAGCGHGTPRDCLLASAFADSALLPPSLAAEVKALVGKADRAVSSLLLIPIPSFHPIPI